MLHVSEEDILLTLLKDPNDILYLLSNLEGRIHWICRTCSLVFYLRLAWNMPTEGRDLYFVLWVRLISSSILENIRSKALFRKGAWLTP